MGNSASSSLPALKTVPVDTAKFLGTWYVIAVKPTAFEKTNSNAVEKYIDVSDSKKHDIDIDFQYNDKEPMTSKLKSLPQKGWVQGDRKATGEWKVSPLWPVKMPYLIIEADEECKEYAVIGYPSRDYCWVLGRKPTMEDKTYSMLKDRLVEKHQYSLEGLREVPQKWTKEERTKRGLTVDELPDSFLMN